MIEIVYNYDYNFGSKSIVVQSRWQYTMHGIFKYPPVRIRTLFAAINKKRRYKSRLLIIVAVKKKPGLTARLENAGV
jgi:hypothetical protein